MSDIKGINDIKGGLGSPDTDVTMDDETMKIQRRINMLLLGQHLYCDINVTYKFVHLSFL